MDGICNSQVTVTILSMDFVGRSQTSVKADLYRSALTWHLFLLRPPYNQEKEIRVALREWHFAACFWSRMLPNYLGTSVS